MNIIKIILILLLFPYLSNSYSAQASLDSLYKSIQLLQPSEQVDSAITIIKNLRNTDPLTGVELGTKILPILNEVKDDNLSATLYDEMGVSFRKLGDFNLSVKYHFEALKLMTELQNEMGQAFVLHNIGNVYRLLKQYDIALNHLFESLKIKNKISDSYQISFSLNTIGLVFEEKGLIDSAEFYMQKALNIAENAEPMEPGNMNLANIYSNYAKIETRAGKYEVAENLILKSLAIYKNGKADYGIAQALGRLAEIQINTREYKEAKSNLDTGFRKILNIKAKDLEKEFYFLYSEYFKRLGNFKESYEHLQKYVTLNENLTYEKGIKQVTHSEFLYEINEKAKENEFLKQQNEITELKFLQQRIILYSSMIIIFLIILLLLSQYLRNKKIRIKNVELKKQQEKLQKLNSELSDLNATQNKLFSIIAHDLRNPFNFLILSSSYMIEEYGQLKEEDKINLLNGIETVSKESNLLLSNLLDWAQIQTGKLNPDQSEFPISESANKNVNLLSKLAEHKGILLNNEIPESLKVCADQDMIDTVFRNLITNSIKFSKTGDIITLMAAEIDNEVEICIEDQGIGMDAKTLENLFSIGLSEKRKGTADESGSGLGLLLCKELVEENGGKIWAESKLGKGTRIFFTLKTNK